MNEIEQAIGYLQPIADSATVGHYGGMLNIALAALREQAERSKGCEYCDFSSGSIGATFDGADDFFMTEHTDGVNLCSDGKEFTLTKINNCPMCGKRLEVEP